MKKIFLILFLISSNIIAQSGHSDIGEWKFYHNGNVESPLINFIDKTNFIFVGGSDYNYPLTSTGLQNAVASIDSGVVYICYPGLWDTTGFSSIIAKNEISLQGWVMGNLITTIAKSKTNTKAKILFNQTADDIKDTDTYYNPFVFLSRQDSWWGTVGIYGKFDKHTPISKQSSSRLMGMDMQVTVDTSYNGTFNNIQSGQAHINSKSDSSSYNVANAVSNIWQLGNNYAQQYQPNAYYWMNGIDGYFDWQAGSDTVTSTLGISFYKARIGLAAGVYFNSNYYHFHSVIPSNLSSRMLNGKLAYHFYGNGDYPSYFGGDLIVDGFNLHSTTAGITASTTQSQGQQVLTTDINEISTVANANDVVTMPTAVAGMIIRIFNNGANTLQIFPSSGDDLGAGVNTSVTLTAGSNVTYISYDATNWEQ